MLDLLKLLKSAGFKRLLLENQEVFEARQLFWKPKGETGHARNMSAPKLEALQPLTLDDGEHDGSLFFYFSKAIVKSIMTGLTWMLPGGSILGGLEKCMENVLDHLGSLNDQPRNVGCVWM